MESLLIWATYQIHIIVSESALGFPEAGSCSDFPRCTQSIAFEYNKFAELVWCAVLCLVAQSCLTLWDLMHYKPPGSFVYGDSSGKNTGVGCHVLQQGIFPTQGSHCRRILYHLSHQGSPRKMKWVAYPFSGKLPDPRIELGSTAMQEDSLPAESPGKPKLVCAYPNGQ